MPHRLEACSGVHHWAHEIAKFGQFVPPYRLSGRRGKYDVADAAAICEAVTRPNMRFVPVKSLDQQGQLLVHRVCQGSLNNRIRDLLSRLGIVPPLKSGVVRREALTRLEDLPR